MAKSKLKKMADNLRAGYEKQNRELEKIIKSLEQVIIDLNTGQLMMGINSEGKALRRYRSASYARFKKTLNPRGVRDLKLTGRFHERFYLVKALPITIYSDDSKAKDLEKDNPGIFGLTKESKKVLAIGYIKDRLADYQRSLIRL